MTRALSLVVVLLLGAAGCGSGDNPSATGSARTSSSAPSNPLNTNENRTACTLSRPEISKQQQVFQDASKGTVLLSDAAVAAGELRKKLSEHAGYSSGEISRQLQAAADASGRTRVALTERDTAGARSAAQALGVALGQIDSLCASIGK